MLNSLRVLTKNPSRLLITMTVSVGPTYSDITVDPNTVKLIFPDEACGSIRPGSLDHLTKLEIIIWGRNMMGLIEPGTIPDGVWLVLRESYKHSIDLSELKPGVRIYTHALNYSQAPTDRCFRILGERISMFPNSSVRCRLTHDHTLLPPADLDRDLGAKGESIYTFAITKVPVVAATAPESVSEAESELESELESKPEIEQVLQPASELEQASEPETDISIEDIQDQVNKELYELSQYPDKSTITKFINANQSNIKIAYRRYAVMKKFIQLEDMDLCRLLYSTTGPIEPFTLRMMIEEAAVTQSLNFMLDFADELGIEHVVPERYATYMFNACSNNQDLELAKRVYGAWKNPDPFKALSGACYSWNREMIDYFLELCLQFPSPTNLQKASLFRFIVASGNMYAFRKVRQTLTLGWDGLIHTRSTEYDKALLIVVIQNSLNDKSAIMITELIDYLSKSSLAFSQENLNASTHSNFWKDYADMVELMCKLNHTEAIRFFAAAFKPSNEQIKLFTHAASSEDAIKAIIETTCKGMAHQTILDFARDSDSITVRKCFVAFYRSLADELD